ncbi:MAG: 1-acyl-sn-glycerol-3-phosphate acyltransferase [Sphaerochaetaceae bacterium]|nr:1-acyl-sn-glycerol-3-phosphate acyltransferase [Sphaerochaetaceae bacterium]
MNRKIVPVFFALDERFLKYGIVSLYSMRENAKRDDVLYKIHFLHSDVLPESQAKVKTLERDGFEISFEDVSDYLKSIEHKFPLRDYYSKTTYYRLFIADMHPEFDKAIYIDSDTIIQGDVADLFDIDIADYVLGACHEQAMVQVDEYGTYVEKCLGLDRNLYFNAGLLLINCVAFRERNVLDRFINILQVYDCVVTQDEDYLNLLCKDHTLFIDQRWNTEVFGTLSYPIEEAKVIHYIMFNKPWHYESCPFADIFYSYAKKTWVYESILEDLHSYTDEQRERDKKGYENLLNLAIKETNKDDTYLNVIRKRQAADRIAILQKIRAYEKEGIFDKDVEDDPPAPVLMPDDIDYLNHTIRERIKTKMAFRMAHKLVDRLVKDKQLIIKDIKGLENFKNMQEGALVTCNHFNAFDSFAIQLAYEAADQPRRKFYRVIREGNYTNFPGFYGFLMRNCNTLPLSSNLETMKKFQEAAVKLLKDGHFVLVYPEQSMWWNYRKPKPLKRGAYVFACKANVPVLPCFITMKDSEYIDEAGFPIQEYTIHIEKPIYPNAELGYRDRIEDLKQRNFEVWKEVYEREYQTELSYITVPQLD